MVSQIKLARCRRQYHYGHVPSELEIEIAGSRGDHYCMGVRIECDKNLNASMLSNVHWAAPNKVAMDFSGRRWTTAIYFRVLRSPGGGFCQVLCLDARRVCVTLDTPAYMCDNWLLHCDAGRLAARLCKVSSLDGNWKPRQFVFSFLHLERHMSCVMLLFSNCRFLTIIH
jgi:hypothetical protein